MHHELTESVLYSQQRSSQYSHIIQAGKHCKATPNKSYGSRRMDMCYQGRSVGPVKLKINLVSPDDKVLIQLAHDAQENLTVDIISN